MVLSMTGYGRSEEGLHGRCISVEIKSVNSRYFEYSSRLPRNCGFLDDPLKKTVARHIARGKVDVAVGMQLLEGGETEVCADLALAGEYYRAMGDIARALGIENDVKATAMARMPDVFTLRRREADEGELTADVLKVAEAALEKYNAMRAVEGQKLEADIRARLETLQSLRERVASGSGDRMKRYTEKLMDRLREVLADTTIEESRILAEAAIFADKTAVDEETVRLASHFAQFCEILDEGGAVGRKLDFLTQELNRETNTIGSKCQEVEITRLVVDMKAEIEKIREQIQNIE